MVSAGTVQSLKRSASAPGHPKLLPSMDFTVGVTGMNATDNPGPGVSVIRSLRHHPGFCGRIVGMAYDTLEPGIYARDTVDASFLLPPPSEGAEALFRRISYIHSKTGLDVLIPTLDAEIPAFIALAERLSQIGVHTFLPDKEQYDRRSKVYLERVAREAGVRVPHALVVQQRDDLYRLDAEFSYPLVVKGLFYGAEIVHNFQDLLAAFHRTSANWGLPVIVQQFVEGEEYDVAALGDGTGGVLGTIPMKKMFLTDKGKGWVGVAVQDPQLIVTAKRLVEALHWRGPCEIEVIREKGTGQYVLLEVNPRFPAWIYLSAGAGMNLPYATALLAAGVDVEPFRSFRVGTLFVRIALEQIVHMSELEQITTTGEMLYHEMCSRTVTDPASREKPAVALKGV